ncbi:hypothetical protein [Aliivibrio wodanis]|uniref:hypothetical protein n=1 Tax=Aliivibrio wodanis TaxID=80852 RepID=UPI00406CA886
MSNKRPSTCTWIVAYVLFPLLPFLAEGAIRFVVSGLVLTLTTFNSSTLSMSMGLQCLFVSQSLASHTLVIPSDEENERKGGAQFWFNTLAIMGFCLFAILILLSALGEFVIKAEQLKEIKENFDVIVFVGSAFPMLCTFWAQLSFKLRAKL